ncbi:MAG: phospholipid/cholesterol/gamma-HCH transport system substrate-binding protein [Candidatus Sumerlaeota bacterium]|nr:phospholipid/cholesterol/gamma-HCH transport system substrate-binding protein [Candidatus Sumerlaeota bacterium]
MEKSKATADTIVGVFVITGIILINLVTFVIRDDLFGSTVRVRATFESVPGLEVGAPVLVSGIRAGRVVSIDYRVVPEAIRKAATAENGDDGSAPATIQPVVVTMRVKDKVPIYSNAVVRLVQQGFIGDKRVEIDPGTSDVGILLDDDSDPLPGEPQFDMNQVMKKAGLMVEDLGATVSSFREFVTDDATIASIRETIENLNRSVDKVYVYLERNEENVAASIEDIRVVAANMKEFSDKLSRFVDEGGRADQIADTTEESIVELRTEMNATLKKAQDAIDAINESVVRMDERADTISDSTVTFLDSTRGDFNALSENLQETSSNLNAIITNIRRGEGTVGRLMTDPKPFEDLKESIEALHEFLIGRSAGSGSNLPYGVGNPPPAAPEEGKE